MGWNLAERYTDIIKTLFVGIFYSPIIPTALIITSLAMITAYVCDKYSAVPKPTTVFTSRNIVKIIRN